jgi:NADH-quinone oxidoreductase subunit C
MLTEALKELAVPAAIEAWDASAIEGGSRELGETLLWIKADKIVAVCRLLKEHLGFARLVGVTCIDRHPLEPRFEVLYLLHSLDRNERLKLKVALAGVSPELDSVTGVWAGANWYEREAFDLFGITFTGHPDLRRIMMPESWAGHPLRKDFPVHGHKYSYQDE